jgi:hypothetical protein
MVKPEEPGRRALDARLIPAYAKWENNPAAYAKKIDPISKNSTASRLRRIVDKPERQRIDAKPETGRLRPVGENMPEVCVADIALNLDAAHTEGIVGQVLDGTGIDRLCERRPASAAIKFLTGVEELRATADAGVESWLVRFAVGSRPGALGAMAARDVKLLRAEQALPFGFSFDDPPQGGYIALVGQPGDIAPSHTKKDFCDWNG